MNRQPPVPKGWRFPLKPSETDTFFPDVEEVRWLGEPARPHPGYESPTIELSRLRPPDGRFEDDAVGFQAYVRVVPSADLVAARQWLMDDVKPEVVDWLEVQRKNSPTRGRTTYAKWCWPSKNKRIHTDS
jgi:hypothetical protein